jgi:hypothetical protein
MTFDEFFAEHRLTPEERAELVYRLAALRARKTIEALLIGGRAMAPEGSSRKLPGQADDLPISSHQRTGT